MIGSINICSHGVEANMICNDKKCQKHPFVCQQQALCERCLQQHSECKLYTWQETEIDVLKSVLRQSYRLQMLVMIAIILNWVSAKLKNLENHLKSYIEPIQRRMVIEYVKKSREHSRSNHRQSSHMFNSKLAWILMGIMLFLCLKIMFQAPSDRNSAFETVHMNKSTNQQNSSVTEYLQEQQQPTISLTPDKPQPIELQTFLTPPFELYSLITNETALIASFFSSKKIIGTKLIYRASQHEFSTQIFHSYCDGTPNMLMIAVNEFDRVFGAFSPIPFTSGLGFEHTQDSFGHTFLFSISYREKLPILLNQRSNALYNDAEWGPSYGSGCDLRIADRADRNRQSYSRFPQSFYNPQQRDADIARYRLTGSIFDQGFKLKEWEVFQVEFDD